MTGKYLHICILTWIISILIAFFTYSCKKIEIERITKIKTGFVTARMPNSCIVSGTIIDTGGENVSQYGHCWSENQSPTLKDSKTFLGFRNSAGGFKSILSDLSPNTTYYVRAYFTNNYDTIFGDQVSFKSLKTGQFTDIDGNVYNSVTIGTQTWMRENLSTARLNDSTSLPVVINGFTYWETYAPVVSWYNNDPITYKLTYGALYNWYAVSTNKLCPSGWHVPTEEEWAVLIDYLGGYTVAGGKMKETGTAHWTSPNTGATNEGGFTAFGGGMRGMSGGYAALGTDGFWWSSTENDANAAYFHYNHYNNTILDGFAIAKVEGFSVRCVKN